MRFALNMQAVRDDAVRIRKENEVRSQAAEIAGILTRCSTDEERTAVLYEVSRTICLECGDVHEQDRKCYCRADG